MEPGDESASHSDWALSIVAFGLWLGVFVGGAGVALFLVIFTVADIAGDGSNSSSTVSARLDPPYAIELENGNSLVVDNGGRTTLNSADDSELHESFQDTTVETMVPIADGRWQGVASTALLIPLFVLAWTATYQLWRVVQSARDGDPFTSRNVSRLRRVAGCIAAVPIVGGAISLGMNQVLSDEINASFALVPSWGFWLVIALAVVAIAEVFGRGVDLRHLTDHTI